MTASGRKALGSKPNNNGENKNSSCRKSKPLMERARRARINESLTELKKIVVTGDEKNGNAAKLEKADILELTVKYLRQICDVQRERTWREGFEDCLEKTKQFLEDSGNCKLYTEIESHLETLSTEDSHCKHSLLENEPINLAIHNEIERKDTFIWRPW